MTEADPLRTRLLRLRREALARLAEGDGIDGGLLRLAADAGAVLVMLDAEAAPEGAPEAARAVVSDNGAAIRLLVHVAAECDPLAAVDLPPLIAIRLAVDLAAAAARHLARDAI